VKEKPKGKKGRPKRTTITLPKKQICSVCLKEKAEGIDSETFPDVFHKIFQCKCGNPVLIHGTCLPANMLFTNGEIIPFDDLDLYCRNCANEHTPLKSLIPNIVSTTPKAKRATSSILQSNQNLVMENLEKIEKEISGISAAIENVKNVNSPTKPTFTVRGFETDYSDSIFYVQRYMRIANYIPHNYSIVNPSVDFTPTIQKQVRSYVEKKRSNWKILTTQLATNHATQLVDLDSTELSTARQMLLNSKLADENYCIKKIGDPILEAQIFETIWGQKLSQSNQDLLLITRIALTDSKTIDSCAKIAKLDKISMLYRTTFLPTVELTEHQLVEEELEEEGNSDKGEYEEEDE